MYHPEKSPSPISRASSKLAAKSANGFGTVGPATVRTWTPPPGAGEDPTVRWVSYEIFLAMVPGPLAVCV